MFRTAGIGRTLRAMAWSAVLLALIIFLFGTWALLTFNGLAGGLDQGKYDNDDGRNPANRLILW